MCEYEDCVSIIRALLFVFPFAGEIQKNFFLLFLVSRPTKNLRFVLSKASFSILAYIQIFFLFCLFSNEHRGVFEAFERRRKVKSRDTLSRTFPKSSFTHTNIHLHFNINNNVCCYSTNRVRRRPQGHQGSSTCLFLSFSFRDPIRSDRARARARDFVLLKSPFCVSNTLYDTGK